jgi:hypothetical protein
MRSALHQLTFLGYLKSVRHKVIVCSTVKLKGRNLTVFVWEIPGGLVDLIFRIG